LRSSYLKIFLDGDPDRRAITVWSVSAGNRLFGRMPFLGMQLCEVSVDQRANKTAAGRPRGQIEPSHTKWQALWRATQRRMWSRQPERQGATGMWSVSQVSSGRRLGRLDRKRRRSFNIPIVRAKFTSVCLWCSGRVGLAQSPWMNRQASWPAT